MQDWSFLMLHMVELHTPGNTTVLLYEGRFINSFSASKLRQPKLTRGSMLENR